MLESADDELDKLEEESWLESSASVLMELFSSLPVFCFSEALKKKL